MIYSSKYDIIGFSKDLGLDISEVSELYSELINELNLSISNLEIFMNKKDLINIYKVIHNMKGLSGNYRLTDIYKETSKINYYLKDNNYNNLELDLNNLFIIIRMAEKEIRNFFKQQSTFI
jgi:hypothetical protein